MSQLFQIITNSLLICYPRKKRVFSIPLLFFAFEVSFTHFLNRAQIFLTSSDFDCCWLPLSAPFLLPCQLQGPTCKSFSLSSELTEEWRSLVPTTRSSGEPAPPRSRTPSRRSSCQLGWPRAEGSGPNPAN